jgi:hypothetical protein
MSGFATQTEKNQLLFPGMDLFWRRLQRTKKFESSTLETEKFSGKGTATREPKQARYDPRVLSS